jgi:hypothetical protein
VLVHTAALPPSLPADLRPGRGKLRLLLLPVLALGAVWLVFHQIEARLLIRGLEPAPMPGVAPFGPGILGQARHFLHDHVLVPPFLLAVERRSIDPGVVGLAVDILTISALAALPGLNRPGKRLLGLGALVVLALAFANLIGFALAAMAVSWSLFRGGAHPSASARSGRLRRQPGARHPLRGGFLIFQPAARDPGWGGFASIAEVLGGYPPAQRVCPGSSPAGR